MSEIDSESGNIEEVNVPKKVDCRGDVENLKMRGSGSVGSKEMIFRADKIDLKNLDMQLEKQLTKVWSKIEDKRPKEEWEIDLAKLNIRYLVAQGSYGTVYRGTYDDQDVAVKILDWGEHGYATDAETAALRASFQTEVVVWNKLEHPNVTRFIGASMGTSDLKVPSKNPLIDGPHSHPARACCVVVEFLAGGTLKHFLIKNRKKKLALKVVIQLALDLSRGFWMVSHITEGVMSTVSGYAYGKCTAVICLTLTVASLMYHLLLCDRIYGQKFQDVVQVRWLVSCRSAGMEMQINGLKWKRW